MKRFARVHFATISAVLLGLALGSGCGSTGVNKGDFNLMSLQDEWALGQKLAADIALQLPLSQDPAVVGYVNEVGQRIVRQTEMAQMPWAFHVVNDPAINAFSIPGGHVYVNTGLITAAGNVSELSGVMAHEISHGVARHSTEQLSKAYGLEILATLVLGQNPAAYQTILAQIIGGGALARFSRDAEEEADKLGVHSMYRAGYNPRGMASMFEELLSREQRSPNSVARFFSTHPLTTDRIRKVTSEAQKLPARGDLITDDPNYQAIRRRVSS